MNTEVKKVKISDISLNNADYKISKNYVSEELVKSIENNGILEIPVLCKLGESYIIVSGFNRIKAAGLSGIDEIDALVENEFNQDNFVKRSLLKVYRNEVGPVGKMRFVKIIREHSFLDEEAVNDITRNSMNIPREFCRDNIIDEIMKLPSILLDYIDIRDCNFKIIKNLIRLKPEALSKLEEWVDSTWMKLNYFRSIVDFLFDIQKREDGLSVVFDIKADNNLDRKANEETIFNAVYKARYPQYSQMKSRADSLVDYFQTKKVKVDFPEYFEGKSVNLSVVVSSGDSLSGISDKLSGLSEEKFKELLDLL